MDAKQLVEFVADLRLDVPGSKLALLVAVEGFEPAEITRLRAEVEALKARIVTRCDFARLLIQKDAMLDIAQGSRDAARAEVESLRSPVARPLAEWHEDMGAVLWWLLPVDEPPYCGQPGDSDWPGYHTHWTPIVVPSNAAQGAPA